MKKLSSSLLISLLFLFSAGATHAESHYVGMSSIGKQKVHAVTGNKYFSLFRPISSWVGERFVFLPKQKTLQRFGYQNFRIGDKLHECPGYDTYVGRTAKVVSLKEVCNHWDIELEMEDNGKRVSSTAKSGAIDGIAPVADMDAARDSWLGKTLWYKNTWIETYDEDTGEIHSVHLEKNSRVKVIDIAAGWKHDKPVRFVLQTTDGQQGYVDIAWSATNSYEYQRNYSDSFETSFFTQDPTKSSKPHKKPRTRNSASPNAASSSYNGQLSL